MNERYGKKMQKHKTKSEESRATPDIESTQSDASASSDWSFNVNVEVEQQKSRKTRIAEELRERSRKRKIPQLKLDSPPTKVTMKTLIKEEQEEDQEFLRYHPATLLRRCIGGIIDIVITSAILVATILIQLPLVLGEFFDIVGKEDVSALSQPFFAPNDILYDLLDDFGLADLVSFLTMEITLSFAIFLIIYIIFMVLPVAIWGKTMGKKLVGIEVIHCEGGFLTYSKVLQRELLGKTFLFPGIIVAFFNKNHRCLHDYLFHSVVTLYDDRLFNPEKKAGFSYYRTGKS